MSAGFEMPSIGDMSSEMRQRLLAILAQQPSADEVPAATPPGFSGFNPPDAPTNTTAMRLGAGPAAMPSLQSLPLPPSMDMAAPRQMPAAPLLAGTLGTPDAQSSAPPQATGPASSVSAPDASPLASMPTLLGLQPPQMPPNGNNGRPAGIPPTAAPANTAAGKPPDEGDGEDTPPNAGLTAPKAPTAYTGLPGAKPVAAPTAVPGAPAPSVSAMPAGSLLGQAPGSTAAPGAPSRPANTSPAVTEPSIWRKLADAGVGDQMIALGAGLASGKNLAEGLGNAFGNVSKLNQTQDATRAATQIAQTKAQREQAQLLGNASVYKKYFPNATDQEAIAGGSNSALMTDLLKRGLPPTETYRTETDEKGNQFQVNTQNGQRSLLKAADEDKTVTPVPDSERQSLGLPPGLYQRDANGKIGTVAAAPDRVTLIPETERAQLGLPPGAYQRDGTGKVSAIGGGGVNITNQSESAEASTIGKAKGETVAGAIGQADPARKRIELVNRMSAGLDAAGSNISTGPGADAVLDIKRFASNVLGRELPGTSATEVFANAGPVLAGEAAKSITSKPAIVEFNAMLNSKPGLANTLEGNRAMLSIIKQGAEHDRDLADLALKSKNAEDYAAKRDQYEEAHPYTNPFTGKPMDGKGSQGDGQAGAPTSTGTPAMGPLDAARAAIAAGADPNKVKTRLLKNGINPQGL